MGASPDFAIELGRRPHFVYLRVRPRILVKERLSVMWIIPLKVLWSVWPVGITASGRRRDPATFAKRCTCDGTALSLTTTRAAGHNFFVEVHLIVIEVNRGSRAIVLANGMDRSRLPKRPQVFSKNGHTSSQLR